MISSMIAWRSPLCSYIERDVPYHVGQAAVLFQIGDLSFFESGEYAVQHLLALACEGQPARQNIHYDACGDGVLCRAPVAHLFGAGGPQGKDDGIFARHIGTVQQVVYPVLLG